VAIDFTDTVPTIDVRIACLQPIMQNIEIKYERDTIAFSMFFHW